MRIGVHVSIAGKIYESLQRAHALGCNTMQIFSRNPRGWSVAPLEADDVKEFLSLKKELDISPVAIHIPYIINIASPKTALYKMSIKSYIDDLDRANSLGAEYFVTHMGSHIDTGEGEGIKRFSKALNEIVSATEPKTTILLETTAGSGSSLGYTFKQIRDIVDGVKKPERFAVCLDTAHVFAAGYDISTKPGLEQTFEEFDKYLGLDLIKVVHFNDSKAPLGSRVDRHEHLGKGTIGLAGLKRIITHPRLKNAAFIMETPKNSEKDDIMNIRTARKMLGLKLPLSG